MKVDGQIRFGARAMYIGSTIYRIHGHNQPWTSEGLGTSVAFSHGQ